MSENIGLVFVHLKRVILPRRHSSARRVWDDLVQEGCLGLIRAAQDYRPQGRIPFAAFALPRIHMCMRRALLNLAPGYPKSRTPGPKIAKGIDVRWIVGKQLHASEAPLREPLGEDSGRDDSNESIGSRLRGKYERAVSRAVAAVAGSRKSRRKDGSALAAALARERHLVPDEIDRGSYRKIAAQTRASVATVVRFDRVLQKTIAQGLRADPEFKELQRTARSHPLGVDGVVNHELDGKLAALSAAEFLLRLQRSAGEAREKMLGLWFEASPRSLETLIRGQLEQMPMDARERLLQDTATGAVMAF